MNISCSTDNLKKALQATLKAVSNKAVLPVLNNLLVTNQNVAGGYLKLVATDLEIGIEVLIEANSPEVFSMTLPAKKLAEIVGKLPDKEIQFTSSKSGVVQLLGIDESKASFSLPTLPADDFPILPQPDAQQIIELNTHIFAQAIRQTSFATSLDTAKSILTGVSLQAKANQLKMAATDGYRLAVRSLDIATVENLLDIIIPKRSLVELEKLLKQNTQETFSMSCSGNYVIFELEHKVLTSRLIEGKYPDYSKILPKTFDKKAWLDTKVFLERVELAATIASEQNHVISFDIQPDKMVISAATAEGQGGKVPLEIKYEGEPITISFNANYLIDVLRTFAEDCPTLCLMLNGETQPVVLQGLNDDSYSCMLMPIKP